MAQILIPGCIFLAGLLGYKVYGRNTPSTGDLTDKLNGKPIDRRMITDLLIDEEIIFEYYVPISTTCHGFVVCRTATTAFITHLNGDETGLSLDVIIVPWEPSSDVKVDKTSMSVKDFRSRFNQFADSFGSYQLGSNDCRTYTAKLVEVLSAVTSAS